jgi:hypothetical protein
MFPNAPEIRKTANYDIFKMIKWNRSLNRPNVIKLIEENRKHFQLHKFPILVTKDFKIIDGQHRFNAAKELGSPVYYIVAEDMDESIKSVHSVNKVGKKHTRGDKLEMMYKAGDGGAELVYKAYNLYQGVFDKTTVLAVLCKSSDGGSISKDIDDLDKIVLNNYEAGLEVLDALFYSSLPEKNKSRMVMSLSMISSKSGVHPKTIVRRVQENLAKWIPPKSRQDNIRSYLTCYNYGMKANRIVITK